MLVRSSLMHVYFMDVIYTLETQPVNPNRVPIQPPYKPPRLPKASRTFVISQH
jgi:hypothetical protein